MAQSRQKAGRGVYGRFHRDSRGHLYAFHWRLALYDIYEPNEADKVAQMPLA